MHVCNARGNIKRISKSVKLKLKNVYNEKQKERRKTWQK